MTEGRFWVRNNKMLRYLPAWPGAICYVHETETWWICCTRLDSGWREGRPLPPPLPPPVEPGR